MVQDKKRRKNRKRRRRKRKKIVTRMNLGIFENLTLSFGFVIPLNHDFSDLQTLLCSIQKEYLGNARIKWNVRGKRLLLISRQIVIELLLHARY